MCTVVLNEIPRLVIEYPIVVTKNGETGQFVCVALFGMDPARNLFWRNERRDSHFDIAVVSERNTRSYLHAMYAMLSSLGHLQILARRSAT